MLADFLTVIPQTPSLVLVTYRPEYEGALARVHGAQTIALAPLSDPETAALVSELLGPDPSVGALGQKIAERAAGNPFFAEEIVRELAERGVLRGKPRRIRVDGRGCRGECACHLAGDHRRAHRSARPASQTHVERGGGDRLAVRPRPADRLGVEPVVADLVAAQLIDQVRFTRQPEYRVPPSADPRGGLRITAQIGSRGAAFGSIVRVLCVGSDGKTCPSSPSGGGRPGDLVPDREAVGHHQSVLGRRQQVSTGPEMRRDAAERRQEPLRVPVDLKRFIARSRCRVG